MKKFIDLAHKFLTENKLIVISIILLSIIGGVYSFFPKSSNQNLDVKNSPASINTLNQSGNNIIYYNSPEEQLVTPNNADLETRFNLELIDWILKNKNEFETTNSIIDNRFKKNFVEKLLSADIDEPTRETVFVVLYNIDLLNRWLDEMAGIQAINMDTYLNNKKEILNKITNPKIKTDFLNLQAKLSN